MRGLIENRRLGFPDPQHVFNHVGAIADDRNVDANVLVNRRGINVDVDFLGIGSKSIEAAGDAIVKTRADVDHHVAIVHRPIGFVGAVHAKHAKPLLVGRRISAKTHQC